MLTDDRAGRPPLASGLRADVTFRLDLLDQLLQIAAHELGRVLGNALPALGAQAVLKIAELVHAAVLIPDPP